jgi:hypothetical protein
MLDDFFKLNAAQSLLTIADSTALQAHFKHSSSLQNASLGLNFEAQQIGFVNVSFTNVRLSRARFAQVTFRQCSFEDCLLIGTRFDECEFHECSFRNCNTHKISIKNVYIDPRAFKFESVYKRKYSNIGAYLFQQLFQNATHTHQTVFAAAADVEKRRWFRRQMLWNLRTRRSSNGFGWIKRVSIMLRILKDFAFDLTAKYGYGPLRFILASAGAFCLVGIVAQKSWPALAIRHDDTPIPIVGFSQALYYCMQLATTLGFSDLRPNTAYGWSFSIGCALLGITWAGLFTAILVRRVIR